MGRRCLPAWRSGSDVFLKGVHVMHFSNRGSPHGGGGWDLTQGDLLFCSLPIVLFLSILSLV
jgi:hypothetical protein